MKINSENRPGLSKILEKTKNGIFFKEAVFHEAKQSKELAFSCWLSNNLSPLGHRQSKLLQLLLI